MKSHPSAWEALAPIERRRFEQAAEKRRAQVLEQREAMRADIRAEMSALRTEGQNALELRGLPNHFSSCRFSSSELEGIAMELAEASGAVQAALADPSPRNYRPPSVVLVASQGMRARRKGMTHKHTFRFARARPTVRWQAWQCSSIRRVGRHVSPGFGASRKCRPPRLGLGRAVYMNAGFGSV